MDDLNLIRLYADACYTYDADGRMLRTNEPHAEGRTPAPRLYLGWTPAGYVLRFGADLPDDQAQELEAIVASYPPMGDLHVPPPTRTAVRRVLERRAPLLKETSGPIYRFPHPITPSGETTAVTFDNRDLVCQTFPWLYDEVADWQPCYAVVRDSAAVSVCFSARLSVQAAAAGVETLPTFRGQGHATAVTLAWGAAIHPSGCVPLYSTWWENLASQGVARRAGLILVGADASWE